MPAVECEQQYTIPGWVTDHASFRRWAVSDDYPERGQLAYLADRVWVDFNMERRNHNFLKMAIGSVLMMLIQRKDLGHYYGDRMLLSHPVVALSTEPDGMFVSWKSFESDVVRELGDDPQNGVEVEGTPDMVLEVVSPGSIRKDTINLVELYWQAGIPEYWLVNPIGETEPQFTIYTHTANGYRAVQSAAGWRKSEVFHDSFRLQTATNRRGQMQYSLEVR